MDQIVVKTEEGNEQILVFYVDGTLQNAEGISSMPVIEHMDTQVQQLDTSMPSYVIQKIESDVDDDGDYLQADQSAKERWSPEDINRLLIFYIDNKGNFLNGTAGKRHLWSVACKTMLAGKTPFSCAMKLRHLKRKYAQIQELQQKGVEVNFPCFDLCHKAFDEDNLVNITLKQNSTAQPEIKQNLTAQPEAKIVKFDNTPKPKEESIVTIKNVNASNRTSDNKVEQMLKLYIKYKIQFQKEYWRKDLWERIAKELEEEDAEYWHKRFLNFKQHYIRMLSKRAETGSESINWPYMSLFDQIFYDDEEFQQKYNASESVTIVSKTDECEADEDWIVDDWNMTEMTVLAKYYFDSFDEFIDPTIPDNFLWNEIGRLLDKNLELCKEKFSELKEKHLEKCMSDEYELRSRNPLAIIFDNIISKEVELELKDKKKDIETWKAEELDELVQFFYDHIEMFKDPVCYYVCWACISKKLKKNIHSCKSQWDDLTRLYKKILEDKKEDPDMQIDWRYIELFDRIFDYGMDSLLYGSRNKNLSNDSQKIGVKKVKINLDSDNVEIDTDEEEYDDEKGYTKRAKRGIGDSRAFKILEFYQKNKDKFTSGTRKKQTLWEELAPQIRLTADQCAHRLRNLKQVYTSYVQREIEKPEMPIMWPYYALCKKVFGYRAIKQKLRNSKATEVEEWTAKEIKQILNFFRENYLHISEDIDDSSKWKPLADQIGKSEQLCLVKFLELRKTYRKLKTMKLKNSAVKVSWKYYNMFDEIHNEIKKAKEKYEEHNYLMYDDMEVDESEVVVGNKTGSQEDEDYQCIIILPEGQDISDMDNSQIFMQNTEDNNIVEENTETKIIPKWTKATKKKLLMLYLKYIRTHKNKEISPKEMWKVISSQLPEKTPLSCRKMLARLKKRHKDASKDDNNKKKTPYYTLLEKIFAIKPKFASKGTMALKEGNYKDIPLPAVKVEQALQYYLLHIEEFVNPRFDKKYLWTQLATFISEPVVKIFNKVNYLKHFYNIETDEVAGEKTLFSELLKAIVTKEVALKALTENDAILMNAEENQGVEQWTDEEIEQLLIWYLANLEQFKNPKYVRKYLWLDASTILNKTPLACSKKMSEIRTLYRNMVKDNSEELSDWKFYSLCQKIYGTGKKNE